MCNVSGRDDLSNQSILHRSTVQSEILDLHEISKVSRSPPKTYHRFVIEYDTMGKLLNIWGFNYVH